MAKSFETIPKTCFNDYEICFMSGHCDAISQQVQCSMQVPLLYVTSKLREGRRRRRPLPSHKQLWDQAARMLSFSSSLCSHRQGSRVCSAHSGILPTGLARLFASSDVQNKCPGRDEGELHALRVLVLRCDERNSASIFF
jgi:hypothetical protein